MLPRAISSCALGALVARRGLKRGSLSLSGALAAFAAGAVILFANAALGLALLAFYFSSSAFTRRREAEKALLDRDVQPGGGRRSSTQVLCTAGVAVAAAVVYSWASGFRDTGICMGVGSGPAAAAAAATDLAFGLSADRVRRLAILAFLGAVACVCGDTWASELGILSKMPPRLITSGRVVPKGTSGGVSLWGTLVSVAGGLFIGAVLDSDMALYWPRNAPCVSAAGVPVTATRWQWLLLPLIGAGAGLIGSLVDSYLGATVQRTWFDVRSGRVTAVLPPGALESAEAYHPKLLKLVAERNELRRELAAAKVAAAAAAAATGADAGAESAAAPLGADGVRNRAGGASAAASAAAAGDGDGDEGDAGREFVVVSGYAWLSNEQVNLVSSFVAAALAAVVGEFVMAVYA